MSAALLAVPKPLHMYQVEGLRTGTITALRATGVLGAVAKAANVPVGEVWPAVGGAGHYQTDGIDGEAFLVTMIKPDCGRVGD